METPNAHLAFANTALTAAVPFLLYKLFEEKEKQRLSILVGGAHQFQFFESAGRPFAGVHWALARGNTEGESGDCLCKYGTLPPSRWMSACDKSSVPRGEVIRLTRSQALLWGGEEDSEQGEPWPH